MVLIACISAGGDVSIALTVSMLNMQTELSQGNATPAIRFFRDVNAAIDFFHATKEFGRLVVVDGQTAAPPAFMLDTSTAADFVVGVYPLEGIDWDRVEKNMAHTTEDPRNVGHVYNVTPGAHVGGGGKFVEVHGVKDMRVFRITRRVVDAIMEKHGDQVVFFAPGTVDGVRMGPAQRLCALWGERTVADIHNMCKNTVRTEYAGCVGVRAVLR